LEGYRLLNPALAKRLKVLGTSEDFPPAVIAYRESQLSESQLSQLRTGLSSASKTPAGKMLMTLWSLKGFEEPKKDYEEALAKILRAYPAPAANTTKRGAIVTGNTKKP
jgi:ABC-type phosphate/phosphonate transport system substrate-binding protein